MPESDRALIRLGFSPPDVVSGNVVRRAKLGGMPAPQAKEPFKKLVIELARSSHDDRVARYNGEFDPGSGLTLAACLTHASRAGANL